MLSVTHSRRAVGARILLALALLASALIIPAQLRGSSHREAPMILKDPSADNVDVYAFRSYDVPGTGRDESKMVSLISTVVPFQDPNSGPYFHPFDPSVLYEIHVDNDGDAVEDITFQFQFATTVANPNTFLYNVGPLTDVDDPDLNLRQTYTLTVVRDGVAKVMGKDLPVSPANVGLRSVPNPERLMHQAVVEFKNRHFAFAGQTDDPFFIDVGPIFDLGGLRPFNQAHIIPLRPAPGIDQLAGLNVNTLAVQVPIRKLTSDGRNANDPNGDNAVIGVWSTTSRRSTTVLNGDGSTSTSGNWVQVSRLGNPLINEVVIPIGMKDYWNSQHPKDDAQFVDEYLNPELAGLVNLLYPSLPDARTSDRQDLVGILLTGLALPDGSNLNNTGTVLADMLRLNMAIPPTRVGKTNRLGVLGGDLAGFPNGRRLFDDVVDIEIRAVADGYGRFVNGIFGSLTPNQHPNNDLGDGVNVTDARFSFAFPHVGTPHNGYRHHHHRRGDGTDPL